MIAIKQVLDRMSRPAVVRVSANIWALTFPLMKLVVGRYVLAKMIDRGVLVPGQPLVESTSGTMGLGLALAAVERGHPTTLVSDPVVGLGLQHKLAVLGARLEIVTSTNSGGNYQQARLDLVHRLRRELGAFQFRQYDRADCIEAYQDAAMMAVREIGDIDWLVAATGSGASATGLARYISKTQGSRVQVAACDTPGSVLFGCPDAKRPFRGLGNSVVPQNLDHGVVDEVHWMTAGPASSAANGLYANSALDVGPTTGAAYLAALDLARRDPSARILFVSPDTGERYRTSFLCPKWLREHGLNVGAGVFEPALVSDPLDVDGPWCVMNWARRSLAEVSGALDRRAS